MDIMLKFVEFFITLWESFFLRGPYNIKKKKLTFPLQISVILIIIMWKKWQVHIHSLIQNK